MNPNKDKHELAAMLKAKLLFQSRIYVYWDGENFKIKNKCECDTHTYIGTFDRSMADSTIFQKINAQVERLICGARIQSSLEKALPIMRLNMDDE